MKKPLNENQVKTIRKMTADNPLHNLLINLSTDLMLRASDLLKLKVSDVMFENGKVRETVKVKQKKTKNYTIDIPLSEHSRNPSQSFSVTRMLMISSLLGRRVTTQEKRFQLFSIKELSKAG